nr:2Fe-2S iron-sulfur cluster-binding protein [Endozoicomonas elysicola]
MRTVEGESINGELSPVQQAYVDAGAVQCGFCTPGLVMKTTSYVEGLTQSAGGCCQSGNIDRDTIRREHAGNLCRCTGYQTVVDAVEQSIQYYSGQK